MTFLLILILSISLYIFFVCKSKIDFYDLKKDSKKIKAEVIDYRKEWTSTSRTETTLIKYPIVKLIKEDGEPRITKLKYSYFWRESFKKPFLIGEKIDVFWSGQDLLYWNAFEKGLLKYLPKHNPLRKGGYKR